jgi:hypothetical protein
LPDFSQFDAKTELAGFRPDRAGQFLKLAGPDEKNSSGSNSDSMYLIQL